MTKHLWIAMALMLAAACTTSFKKTDEDGTLDGEDTEGTDLDTVDGQDPLPDGVDVVERTDGGRMSGSRMTLRVRRSEAPSVTAWVLNALPVVDLSVEDPPIEAVIDQIYQEGDIGGQS